MTGRPGRHQGDSGAVARVAESARTRLWPLPVTAVIISLVVGDGLLRVDAWADDLPAYAQTVLFGGDADAARSVLETIAGSLMTVTSLTFSLTVVTLQLASSQFSPRLLRTFAADRFVQATLALFLSTFVFALTVLRSVRGGDGLTDEFIPRLSVTVTFVLTLASVLALVLFLAHLAREIRVETMLDAVHRDAEATIERELDSNDDISERGGPRVPHDARPLLAERTGFLQSIDAGQLCRIAGEHNLTLRVVHPVGAWIVHGTPWVFVQPTTAADLTQVERSLQRHLRIGVERSGSADVSFGLRQITDVAVKALSPGINDPTTAVHALSHSAGLLCLLAERNTGPEVLRDSATDEVRVVVPRPSFSDLLDIALAQPRRYGATEPAVLTAILRLLRAVAWSDGSGRRRAAIGDELDRTQAVIAGQDFDHVTRADLANQILAVRDAFARRWRPDQG